ncbi:DUF6478 family protein [Celeribacter sp.]|uniref:DUF6478 family protein n=1 Tax=Celeribacter sp. TaxID=1890673 RepID=UPI003A9564FA
MPGRVRRLLERRINRITLARWARRGKDASSLDLENLRDLRHQARKLRSKLDDFLFTADGRLALPLIGSNAMQLPLYTDWSYRPEIWRGPIQPRGQASVQTKTPIGSEAMIFHDCRVSELTYRQLRNVSQTDLAPFGLGLDVFRFDGSFLSLSIDLPNDVCDGLGKRHIIRLDCSVDAESPIEIFARLNVKHGPNNDEMVRELPLSSDEVFVEFDLAYTNLDEKRVEKLWVDLIFEGPQMNQIVLRDVTLSRRPRAQM